MKKKLRNTKLTLNRSVVRRLSDQDAAQARGGVVLTWIVATCVTCWQTCAPTCGPKCWSFERTDCGTGGYQM